MRINKDTTLCMSLASRPSNLGTRFHNYLYEALNLNYIYKAFAPEDLSQAIAGVRGLAIRGCAISMPYKEQVIQLIDEMDASATAIQSVNTIVNTDGHLKAYNTDYMAIVELLEKYQISNQVKFAVKGSGGMAKAVIYALKNQGFEHGTIVAKNHETGQKLAQAHPNYIWKTELDDHDCIELLINATPVGMKETPFAEQLAFSQVHIEKAKIIFDVVAIPEQTPLIQYAQSVNKQVITGAEVFALQALQQFYLYTGIYPDQELFEQAKAFSRSENI